MTTVLPYIVLILLALLACVFLYIPKSLWFNARVAKEEFWGTLKIVLIGIGTSLLCFFFSKLLFSAFCLSISASVIEYNILINNVYWVGAELVSPFRTIKYTLSYFGLHTLSYFAGLYAILYCLSKLNIISRYHLAQDRLKLQLMCLGLYLFFETLLYVSYPFQTFASGWRVFHNIFAVFIARLHFTVCLFIAAWVQFHYPYVKMALRSKVLVTKIAWLSQLFWSTNRTIGLLLGLGVLFLLPAFLRSYAPSDLGLVLSILFNGGLLLLFWRWVAPTVWQLMRFVIAFEKRKTA